MRTNTAILPIKLQYSSGNLEDIDKILFFDIETTGFSANTSFLYLIGCLYWNPEKSSFEITQWFCEKKEEESLVLYHFFTFLENFSTVVTYNGQGFDIPYLEKKCRQYNLPYSFSGKESMDIYKKIAPFRNFLKLSHLKQKSIEEFLEIERDDIYSGGELIAVYEQYLITSAEESFRTLLLHNFDDLGCLVRILPILAYTDLFRGDFRICQWTYSGDSSEIIFVFETLTPLPKRISYGNQRFYFTGFQHTAKLKIKIYTGELKYFYPNYQDYYYLPEEDRSIHKSVAFYVDKNFRTKARAANCYSKKTGKFLPQQETIVTPYFKIEYADKETFFELTDDFLENPDLIKAYVLHILHILSKMK